MSRPSASSVRRIRIPPIYRPVFTAPDVDDLAVLHAALDCRALESFLAIALSRPGTTAIVTVQAARARKLLADWLAGRKVRKFRSPGFGGYEVGDRALWLVEANQQLEDPPFARLDALFVVDAHRIRRSPIADLGSLLDGPSRVAGEPVGEAHWFARFQAEAGRVERIDHVRAVEAWPDLASKVLEESDRRFGRLMQLRQDKLPRIASMTRFAATRLKVRTDKHPDTLTERQRLEAAEQLGKDWYRRSSGRPLVTYDLNAMQRWYLARKMRARREGVRHFALLKARRGGFSTLEQALSYRTCVGSPGATAMTVAHTDEDTMKIFRMVSGFHGADPHAPRLVGDSRRMLSFDNGSIFQTLTAGGRGQGRGDTITRVHGSEVSRWLESRANEKAKEDLVAGLLEACAHGEVTFESTANGVELFCRTYRGGKLGTNRFCSLFVPWFVDPTNIAAEGTFSPREILETLDEEERALIDRHGLSPAQIAFRRDKRKDLGRVWIQEYPEDDESCFLTSGTCFFDTTRILDLLEAVPDYERKPIPGGSETIWQPPEAGVEYGAGADTSYGTPGRDRNGVGVIRRDTLEQVAAVHGHFNIDTQAYHAVRMARRYNNALLGIEANNHGHAVLKRVEDLGYGLSHTAGGSLFHWSPGKPGWDTNPRSRMIMLDDMWSAIQNGTMIVRDRDFLAECLTFVLKPSGKYEASEGNFDDQVIKWSIALQMATRHFRAGPGLTVF